MRSAISNTIYILDLVAMKTKKEDTVVEKAKTRYSDEELEEFNVGVGGGAVDTEMPKLTPRYNFFIYRKICCCCCKTSNY